MVCSYLLSYILPHSHGIVPLVGLSIWWAAGPNDDNQWVLWLCILGSLLVSIWFVSLELQAWQAFRFDAKSAEEKIFERKYVIWMFVIRSINIPTHPVQWPNRIIMWIAIPPCLAIWRYNQCAVQCVEQVCLREIKEWHWVVTSTHPCRGNWMVAVSNGQPPLSKLLSLARPPIYVHIHVHHTSIQTSVGLSFGISANATSVCCWSVCLHLQICNFIGL